MKMWQKLEMAKVGKVIHPKCYEHLKKGTHQSHLGRQQDSKELSPRSLVNAPKPETTSQFLKCSKHSIFLNSLDSLSSLNS